jgi:hypothetical protein
MQPKKEKCIRKNENDTGKKSKKNEANTKIKKRSKKYDAKTEIVSSFVFVLLLGGPAHIGSLPGTAFLLFMLFGGPGHLGSLLFLLCFCFLGGPGTGPGNEMQLFIEGRSLKF